MDLTNQSNELLQKLRNLNRELRQHTYSKFNRVNPFYENLFDWKESGEFWHNKNKNVTIYNSTTISGDVEIGENCWIGPFCSLDGSGGLKIGEHCSISVGTQILTHDTVKWAVSGGKHPYEYSPTAIGDYCFIGSHAVIAKGVKIGKHCVVGAGAVVLKDIADYSIVAGVPAKKIGFVEVNDEEVELHYSGESD